MKTIIIIILLNSLVAFSLDAQQEKLSMNKGWSFQYIAPDSKEIESVLINYFYKNGQSATIGWSGDELMELSYNDSAWRKIRCSARFCD